LQSKRHKAENNPLAEDTMKKATHSHTRGKLHCEECKKKRKLDALGDRREVPTSVTLMALDGGIEHAVAMFGDWVFDTSMPHALPLCKESLDWCCQNGCLRSHSALRCVPDTGKSNKKKGRSVQSKEG